MSSSTIFYPARRNTGAPPDPGGVIVGLTVGLILFLLLLGGCTWYCYRSKSWTPHRMEDPFKRVARQAREREAREREERGAGTSQHHASQTGRTGRPGDEQLELKDLKGERGNEL
jgi:hypothetical protein